MPLTFETVTSFGGIFASVAAAVAGFFRFRAWWSDREKQTRIESATFFKEKGSEQWQREFGEEQLVSCPAMS
jgi:hypothetical protein